MLLILLMCIIISSRHDDAINRSCSVTNNTFNSCFSEDIFDYSIILNEHCKYCKYVPVLRREILTRLPLLHCTVEVQNPSEKENQVGA